MRSQGYKFEARDPKIAVSKVLRLLAEAERIEHRRGEHAKSPIIYWVEVKPTEGKVEVPTWKVPVQETTH